MYKNRKTDDIHVSRLQSRQLKCGQPVSRGSYSTFVSFSPRPFESLLFMSQRTRCVVYIAEPIDVRVIVVTRKASGFF